MRDRVLLLVLAACSSATAPPPAPYDVGRPVAPGELAALDLTVLPSGAGLPPGRATARDGAGLYVAQCASCHGLRGEGVADYPPLVGGRGTLRAREPLLTIGSYWPYATTVFDYIRRAMPYLTPGTLTTDQVYALTAYVLHANGIIAADAVIDERSLPLVIMPNRHGFLPDPRPRHL
jgi:S-disulfanyl-L-cysteine oxidoreductase SoxD